MPLALRPATAELSPALDARVLGRPPRRTYKRSRARIKGSSSTQEYPGQLLVRKASTGGISKFQHCMLLIAQSLAGHSKRCGWWDDSGPNMSGRSRIWLARFKQHCHSSEVSQHKISKRQIRDRTRLTSHEQSGESCESNTRLSPQTGTPVFDGSSCPR